MDRKVPEINAGSMADIAFLLLVFFLVTTTIQTDAGLYQMLPQWVEDEGDPDNQQKKNKRNVLQVKITASDQLIVEAGQETAQLNYDVANLKEKALEFLTNNDKNQSLSEKPTKAVIVLQNDNGTTYNMYLRVMNELNAAYNVIWNQAAKDKHGVAYDALTEDQQEEIRMIFPKILSEADATDFDKKK